MRKVGAEKSVPCKGMEFRGQRPRGKRNIGTLADEVRQLCYPEDSEKSRGFCSRG